MNKVTIDVLMQERIEKFNNFVMNLDIDKIPIGLFSGKMGICIYFYHQAQLSKSKEYEKFAEKLLDSIYSQVHSEMPIDIENGLAGICYGINYLIEENFVKGNVNTILKELDDRIFKSLNFIHLSNNSNMQIENPRIILGVLYYFSIRLENNKLASSERYSFKSIIIKAINKIESTSLQDKFTEPYLFTSTNYFLPIYLILLSKIHKQDFYNYKVAKIFDEMSDRIKSTYPLLQSDRLLLSIGLRSVEEVERIDDWSNHIKLLEQNIDFPSMIDKEFRNKDILPNNGITGLYYFLISICKRISFNKNLFTEKIIYSDLWDQLDREENKKDIPFGLVTGFSGVILTYQDTLNKE